MLGSSPCGIKKVQSTGRGGYSGGWKPFFQSQWLPKYSKPMVTGRVHPTSGVHGNSSVPINGTSVPKVFSGPQTISVHFVFPFFWSTISGAFCGPPPTSVDPGNQPAPSLLSGRCHSFPLFLFNLRPARGARRAGMKPTFTISEFFYERPVTIFFINTLCPASSFRLLFFRTFLFVTAIFLFECMIPDGRALALSFEQAETQPPPHPLPPPPPLFPQRGGAGDEGSLGEGPLSRPANGNLPRDHGPFQFNSVLAPFFFSPPFSLITYFLHLTMFSSK